MTEGAPPNPVSPAVSPAPVMSPLMVGETTDATPLTSSTPPTSPTAPGALNYAGFGARFLASIIDWLILLIPTVLIAVVLALVMTMFDLGFLSNVVSFLLISTYFAYLESSPKQASFGKQAMKIKVTDLNGQPLTLKQAYIRNLAKFLSSFILCIGYLFVFFTPKKQALHDKIAKCVVIKTE